MKRTVAIALLSTILFAFSASETILGQYTAAPVPPLATMAIDTSGAKQFWDTLKKHCGKAYEGKIVSGPAGDDFMDKRLVMYVLSCSADEILIPFNVGDNRSRTWILKYKDGRIELKHDHRHEDGTSDDVTMYGGTTSNRGLPGIAVFPADEETTTIIPAAATNVWWITVGDKQFTYNLRRMGADRFFSVSFYLAKEIEKPLPSWGWEDFVAPR